MPKMESFVGDRNVYTYCATTYSIAVQFVVQNMLQEQRIFPQARRTAAPFRCSSIIYNKHRTTNYIPASQ